MITDLQHVTKLKTDKINKEILRTLPIYDNGGATWDRYTVIIDRDAYGMSDNATEPGGFNQYICDVAELDMDALKKLNRKIEFDKLPEQVQTAINKRIAEYGGDL